MFQLRLKYLIFLNTIAVVVLPSCASNILPSTQTKQETTVHENILLADPTIFFDSGTYHLYGTGSGKYSDGFISYTSTDFKKWTGPAGKKDGYALSKVDAYGDAKFWAPQVFKYNNKFYIAYAANEHIAIAFSDDPTGPFMQDVIKSVAEETKQIDPYVFIDDNGKKYLYYVVVANGGNRIFVAEMNDDMLSVKPNTAKQCIEATDFWENTEKDKWSVTEGPAVIKHNNLYYLIYSANHFKYATYAVGYAISKSPYGPWQKYEGNPVIDKIITGQNGSGHGDLVKGRNNQMYYVLHTHNSQEKVHPRKTGIVKMKFIKDKKTGIDKLMADPGSFSYLYHQ